MTFNCSDKQTVQWLLPALKSIGVKKVVLSPGSRNAPLIISFGNSPEFECYNIVDERSAAFYALGMAKQLNEPVAICCTSGSAVLNYAPAISEALYQEIPLIVITADRPPELIDQEDGQTIHQENIFRNYIKKTVNLPVSDHIQDDDAKAELIKGLTESISVPKGPIHVNIPFNEPLYQTIPFRIIDTVTPNINKWPNVILEQELIKTWKESEKTLFVVGSMPPNSKIQELLNDISQFENCFIFASPISNLNNPVSCSVESVVYNNNPGNLIDFAPDLLITIGGPVVSKTLKQFIRKAKPQNHWDIDLNPKTIDTYQCLSNQITAEPSTILNQLIAHQPEVESNYAALWKAKVETTSRLRTSYIHNQPWNDFQVFAQFFDSITEPINLHLANSTPVRYAELFDKHPQINYYCNRGTSGIDGTTSTAVGAAIASNKITYLITGDLSFMYDSNALWNNHLPDNFKIILINNQGGNIFKIIKGPSDSEQLEHFQANTPFKAEQICKAFDIEYYSAKDTNSYLTALNLLKESHKCTVLELFTDAEISAKSYKQYFQHLME